MEQTSRIRPVVLLDIPEWLSAPTENLPALTPREMREMTDQSYAAFFETVLEKVAGGNTFTDVVREDGRYDLAKYNHWVQKDPERKAQLDAAKEMATPLIEDQMLDIADAAGNALEDVQRSTLRINARWKLLAVQNKQRYGTTHQIEVKNNNPLREDSLEALAGRLQGLRRQVSGEVVDVVAREQE